jgi:hypothetical protein
VRQYLCEQKHPATAALNLKFETMRLLVQNEILQLVTQAHVVSMHFESEVVTAVCTALQAAGALRGASPGGRTTIEFRVL